jgi:hypothetical protein
MGILFSCLNSQNYIPTFLRSVQSSSIKQFWILEVHEIFIRNDLKLCLYLSRMRKVMKQNKELILGEENLREDSCFVSVFVCVLGQGLTVYPSLPLNLLCSPGWPQTHNSPAFTSLVLAL